MWGTLRTAVTCAAVAALAAGCAGGMAQSASSAAGGSIPSYGIYGTDSYFALEWRPGERRGKPTVNGYVTNRWGLGVKDVRLRVEALDAAGAVTAVHVGYVFGDVTPGTRAYFEVPVAQQAASYRVSVLSYDPVQCRG